MFIVCDGLICRILILVYHCHNSSKIFASRLQKIITLLTQIPKLVVLKAGAIFGLENDQGLVVFR